VKPWLLSVFFTITLIGLSAFAQDDCEGGLAFAFEPNKSVELTALEEESAAARERLANSPYAELLKTADKALSAQKKFGDFISAFRKFDNGLTPEQFMEYLELLKKMGGGSGGGDGFRQELVNIIEVATEKATFGIAIAATQTYYTRYVEPSETQEVDFVIAKVNAILNRVTFQNEDGFLASTKAITDPNFKVLVNLEARKKWSHDKAWQYLFR